MLKAFIVGIENYMMTNISPVSFAQNDANEIADALKGLGVDTRDVILHTNDKATKSVIESTLNQCVKQLRKDDFFYFFYAGHGFSSAGNNYITCYDTLKNDPENTSIRLQDIFNSIKAAASQRAVLFVDACHSGMSFSDNMRGILSSMNDVELEKFFHDAEGCVCFSACHEDEKSFSHPSIKHGIWSYHIIKALRGEAKNAIEKSTFITVDSLQNYLAEEVPRTIRKLHTTSILQTPWFAGSLNKSFPVANISKVLERKKPSIGALQNLIVKAEIYSIRFVKVKLLAGFSKTQHKVPSAVTSSTEAFVRRIANDDIKQISDQVFAALKSNFGYKRKDLKVDIDQATLDIITPNFDYHCSISIVEKEPTEAQIVVCIDNISNGQIVLSDEFNKVFNEGFTRIEFSFNSPVLVEELIDELEGESKKCEYDKDCTYCDIRIQNADAKIRIEKHSFSIISENAVQAKTLFALVNTSLSYIGNYNSFNKALTFVQP